MRKKLVFYHIFPEYGFIELIDKNGKSVTKEDEVGEIVATGFNNFIFPFIRYRTMDLGVYTTEKCKCGRECPLLKRVEGRLQELIIAKDGSLIPHVSWIHEVVWTGVKQLQFLQETQGELTIKVVKETSYSDAEIEASVLGSYKPKFKGLCELNIEFVDHIPHTQSGKYRFLIQKLPIEFWEWQS